MRNGDTTKQIRVKISDLKVTVQKILKGEEFSKLGKPVK
ncbi:MAG: hypothetical protein MUP45_00690 [Candidatus Marinimicrobia bacterium]|nr:hypothetical protein [Candidatus Neomarinimicrobiota bacterium]